jgi:DNA replicative helicase MCM subunit Mcm2 (Cdc46/Mcm family)
MQSDELNRMSQTIISDIKREFIRFLQEFGDRKYITMGESILDSGKHLIVISYQDFITHNSELASTIFEEYYRYEPHLNDAFTHLMRELERSYFIG